MDPSHQSSEAFVDGDAEEDEEADDETNRMDAHVEDDDDLSADSDSASSSPESLPFSRVDANPRTLLTSRRNDMRSTLTVLLVGLASGHTHLLIGGTLAFGAWSPLATSGDSDVTSGDVASALVDDVARRLVVLQCQRVHSVSIGALMHDRAGELREAWMRCTSVSGLLNSLSHAATEMSDAWEKSIVDFDARMSRFSAEIRELGRTVHQDMLQMLTCGQVSSELETFLVSDLNEAGLKRLGTALDASYTRLVGVGNNAIRIAQLLVLRLGELVAFARCKRRYALLGLNEQACQATVDLAAAFVLKCIDLLRILQRVRTGLREFLFWLRIWMHKLADEAVPASLKDHQINTDVIVEFLRSNVAWDDDHAAASTGTSTTRRSDTQRASAFFARQDMPPLRVTATEKTYSTSSSSSNSEPYKSYVVSERASLMQLLDQLIAAHSAMLNEMHAAGSRALNNTTRNDDLISRALPPSSRRVHMIEASNSSSSDGGDGGGGCSLLLNVVRNGTSASITRIYPTGAPTPHETTMITCTPDTSERIRNAQLYDSDTVALLLGKNVAPTPSAPVASAQTDLALVPLDSAFEHSSSVWSDLSDRHRSFPVSPQPLNMHNQTNLSMIVVYVTTM